MARDGYPDNYEWLIPNLPPIKNAQAQGCVFRGIGYSAEMQWKGVEIDDASFVDQYEAKVMVPLLYDNNLSRVIDGLDMFKEDGLIGRLNGETIRLHISGYKCHGRLLHEEVFQMMDAGTVIMGTFPLRESEFNALGAKIYYLDPPLKPKEKVPNHLVTFVGHGKKKGRPFLLFPNTRCPNLIGRVYFREIYQFPHRPHFSLISVNAGHLAAAAAPQAVIPPPPPRPPQGPSRGRPPAGSQGARPCPYDRAQPGASRGPRQRHLPSSQRRDSGRERRASGCNFKRLTMDSIIDDYKMSNNRVNLPKWFNSFLDLGIAGEHGYMSFCMQCLKRAASKCGKRCPKCRQLISNSRACTINTVLWNTIQLLFPSEVEARKTSIASCSASMDDVKQSVPRSNSITQGGTRSRNTSTSFVVPDSTGISNTNRSFVTPGNTRSMRGTGSMNTSRGSIDTQDRSTRSSRRSSRSFVQASQLVATGGSDQSDDSALAYRLQQEEFMTAFHTEDGERQPQNAVSTARANLRAMASRAVRPRTEDEERQPQNAVSTARENLRAMASRAVRLRARGWPL